MKTVRVEIYFDDNHRAACALFKGDEQVKFEHLRDVEKVSVINALDGFAQMFTRGYNAELEGQIANESPVVEQSVTDEAEQEETLIK